MVEIVVTGSAQRALTADRAVLALNASANYAEREPVVRRVTAQHEHLVARAKELVGAGFAARYFANPIETHSNSWRDGEGRAIAEHYAQASVEIEITALDLVGELTAEFAVDGVDAWVSWQLSPELREGAMRELRAEAVADARRAAEDYAAAVEEIGARLVSLRDGRPGFGGPVPIARAMMADAKASPEVTVREVEVSVQLEASFVAG